MSVLAEASAQQSEAAAERVGKRTSERRDKIDAITSGKLVAADEPVRIASRIDRLSRYYPGVRPVSPAALEANDPKAVAEAGAVLERIINTPDFVDVRYLEAGARAAHAVGRVDIRDHAGRVIGFGTGSLVTSRLLLTNHHVLPDAETAAASEIEFNFEDGIDGQPLQPRLFPLDPTAFFLADEKLDFALVAVGASVQDLAEFGFNPTIRAQGKAIAGDFVTIVQHPEGQKKQVALRDNRVVDVLDDFLHYEADTQPGSSGSPVFNDQWELIALHHASVPAPDHPELGKFVNEGIRVSQLLAFIGQQVYTDQQRALVADLVGPGPAASAAGRAAASAVTQVSSGSAAASAVPPASSGPAAASAVPQVSAGPASASAASSVSAAPPASNSGPAPAGPDHEAAAASPVSVTVPLRITIGVGDQAPGLTVAAGTADEAIAIDPTYADRQGYDPRFLGAGAAEVPLPALSDALLPLAAVNSMATADPRYVLPYHHFSVVLNKERKLAFYTAVNIDGASGVRLRREPDRWFFDPRVPEDQQTGEPVYQDNPLDRGHLVRRLDPAWGATPAAAKIANDDTFHFTNCTPQHHDFNAGRTLWAGLENYLLDNADNLKFRVSVFSGPVFAADDEQYRGVQLPRQFWKVVAMVKPGGDLSVTAYLLSQEELIKGLEVAPEAFSYGAYRTYQVKVSQIEGLTGLSFGSLADADPLARDEAAVTAREVTRPEELLI